MAPTPAPTFWQVLGRLVERGGGDPLVTFYDEATGERVELSGTTYANWVAKTASLLQDELDLTRGDLVVVDLPTHWLGPVWLGAVWALGAVATDATDGDDVAEAAVVVSGPDTLERHAQQASGHVVGLLAAARWAHASPPLPRRRSSTSARWCGPSPTPCTSWTRPRPTTRPGATRRAR